MGNRLVIIGIQEGNLRFLVKQIELIFSEFVPVIGITLKELNYKSIASNDIVLLTTEEIHALVKPFLPESVKVIVAERAINVVNLKTLMNIKESKKILIVNDNATSTIQTVHTLKHILPIHTYEAYGLQKELSENIDFILTPGETNLIPSDTDFAPVIDIGPRVIALETLTLLKEHLQIDIEDELFVQLFIKAMVFITGDNNNITPVTLQNQNHHRTFADLLNKSSAMDKTLQIANQVAQTSNAIHIEGGVGTGKQMLAEMIHNASSGSSTPFYVYSCSEKDPQIMEEELFGNHHDNIGIVNQITSGTLYIKNIEQLPYLLQEKLHNLIQSSGDRTTFYPFRIITASLNSLSDLFQEKLIRTNVYAYLSSYTLRMPLLSERYEDITILIDAFKKHFNKTNLQFSESTMNAFYHYDWPGNVRELYNVISYCVCLNESYIEPALLPLFFKGIQKNIESQKTATDQLPIEKMILEIEKHGFLSESIELLEIFREGKNKNESYGRGKVKQFLEDKGFHLTDQQLKLRIKVLNDLGLLNVRIGRAGTTIAEKGEQFLNKYKALQET